MGFSSLPNAGNYVLGVCGCVCLCVFDDDARACVLCGGVIAHKLPFDT